MSLKGALILCERERERERESENLLWSSTSVNMNTTFEFSTFCQLNLF